MLVPFVVGEIMFNVELHNYVVNNGLMVTDVSESNNCFPTYVYGIWFDFLV